MALGPIARVVAQVVVLGVSVLSRALPAAYAQAVQNAKKGGGAAAQSVLRKQMSRDEALQILNLADAKADASPEAILKVSGRFWFLL
jgi:import inner membrane translocase subunit TIM16